MNTQRRALRRSTKKQIRFHLKRVASLLPIGVLLAIFIVMGWNFVEEYRLRSALQSRGIETTAIIESRQVKACFGLRCSDPVYFSGGRGDPDFDQFNKANCGRGVGRGSRENCWYYLRFTFTANEKQVTTSESVHKVRNQQLRPGQTLRVRFDPKRVTSLKVIGDGKGDPDYFVSIFVLGVGAFVLWLSWGMWVARRRERRGWSGPNYA